MATNKRRPKNIKYLNKDFMSFRDNLIQFTKTYFPDTNTDFNESSPGMLFIELSSYIGDVLSYYIDDSLKESLMVQASDRRNVLSLSQYLGYKPKVTSPSITTLSVYQLVPAADALDDDGNAQPDERFFLRVQEGLEVESNENANVKFVTTDVLDFSDPFNREITVYQKNETTNEPETFLVKKQIEAVSGDIIETTVNFGDAEPFSEITLPETDVIEILDVRDEDGYKYYEVPYLAQQMVYVEYPNNASNDPDLAQFRESVPNILKLLKTPRRFVTKVNQNNTTTITFGGGTLNEAEERLLIPTFKNVGLGTRNSINQLNKSFDPTNFLRSNSYGQAPDNTAITVRYLTGGGVESNVPAGDLTRITSISFETDTTGLSQAELDQLAQFENTVAVENEVPGVGGRGPESIEEIRQNALANFNSQNRAVTKRDYVVRTLSMPPRLGSVAKAYAAQDGELDNNSPSSVLRNPESLARFAELVQQFLDEEERPTEEDIKQELSDFVDAKQESPMERNNPFAVNLYVLGYNENQKLSTLNKAVKENLKQYIEEHRMLTDGVNIIDGFIINIGVDFDISVYPNYNKREVVLSCIQELRDYFNIENWTFNDTINLSEIEVLLASIEGVSSVSRIEITNKCNGEYSNNEYNIAAATKNNIVYPSLDPSVFELKFPDRDIRGRAI